jgi:hypothetical protein
MRTLMTFAVLGTVLAVMPTYADSERAASSEVVEDAGRLIRLNVRDGSSQVVTLDGVGCDETICSRVAVNARSLGNVIANRTRFADIAVIRDISEAAATFVLKDGTTQRLSVVPDNRVLYVFDANHRPQKISLHRLTSVEFNATRSPRSE